MVYNYIWIKKQRYYYYKTYESWNEALKMAKRQKNKNGCRYFILPVESKGFFKVVPEVGYKLYLNKCMRLFC